MAKTQKGLDLYLAYNDSSYIIKKYSFEVEDIISLYENGWVYTIIYVSDFTYKAHQKKDTTEEGKQRI